LLSNYNIKYICSVPARISKGQGAGPEKGLFSALLDFQTRGSDEPPLKPVSQFKANMAWMVLG
jgi:hypothetical protein